MAICGVPTSTLNGMVRLMSSVAVRRTATPARLEPAQRRVPQPRTMALAPATTTVWRGATALPSIPYEIQATSERVPRLTLAAQQLAMVALELLHLRRGTLRQSCGCPAVLAVIAPTADGGCRRATAITQHSCKPATRPPPCYLQP